MSQGVWDSIGTFSSLSTSFLRSFGSAARSTESRTLLTWSRESEASPVPVRNSLYLKYAVAISDSWLFQICTKLRISLAVCACTGRATPTHPAANNNAKARDRPRALRATRYFWHFLSPLLHVRVIGSTFPRPEQSRVPLAKAESGKRKAESGKRKAESGK